MSGQRKIIRLDMVEYICEGLNIKLKENMPTEMYEGPQVRFLLYRNEVRKNS